METKIINNIAVVNSNELIIKDVESAIDFIMSIKYETNCNKIALTLMSLLSFSIRPNISLSLTFSSKK